MTKQPKSQNPTIQIGRPPDLAYWQALGHFVEVYAGIEGAVFALLNFYAQVPFERGKALFSGTRVDASIKLIRRLVAVTDPGEQRRRELELMFTQLAAINDARNDIMHYGTHQTAQGRMSTNIVRAHLPENVRWRPISTEILLAMIEDLHVIGTHLIMHQHRISEDDARKRLSAFSIATPWLYKPPQDHEMKPNKRAHQDQPR